MQLIITGATGFIGRHLCGHFAEEGHRVIALTRSVEKGRRVLGDSAESVEWDAKTAHGWQSYMDGTDVVINLAGENLGDPPWTKAYKQRILDSRIHAGAAVSQALQAAKNPPKVLLQASGIGFYGDRHDEILKEDDDPGEGFVADVVRQWEASVAGLTVSKTRIVFLRTAAVLGEGEGLLGKLALPFKLFAGGPPGGGQQFLSWIHIADVVGAIRFLIERDDLQGPVNLTSPNPLRMVEFCDRLGNALHRPSWLPVPAFMLKLIFSEMADEILLASQRALPERLLQAGYEFRFPQAGEALENVFSDREPV